MSAETHRLLSDSHGRAADVVVGSLSGLVAGVIGSIVLQVVGASHVFTGAVPALVGLETPAPIAGWLLFMLISLGIGLLYAGLLAGTNRDITDPTRGVIAGAAYGVALWVTIAVVFVPLATAAVGYANAPAFPYVDVTALAGYLSYGVVLGVFHAALAGYQPATTDSGKDVAA